MSVDIPSPDGEWLCRCVEPSRSMRILANAVRRIRTPCVRTSSSVRIFQGLFYRNGSTSSNKYTSLNMRYWDCVRRLLLKNRVCRICTGDNGEGRNILLQDLMANVVRRVCSPCVRKSSISPLFLLCFYRNGSTAKYTYPSMYNIEIVFG